MKNKVEEIKTPKKEFKYKTLKKITGVPFLKIESGAAEYVKLTSKITYGTMKKKPAMFASGVNLQTGEIVKILLGSVLARQLLDNYGEEGFVNLSFRIEKGEKVKGEANDYFEYEIEEIEA